MRGHDETDSILAGICDFSSISAQDHTAGASRGPSLHQDRLSEDSRITGIFVVIDNFMHRRHRLCPDLPGRCKAPDRES